MSFPDEVRRRRDQSLYVTHFTRDLPGCSAGEALRSILRAGRIEARPLREWDGEEVRAVCLTEAPLLGLIVPTAPRSPSHGVGLDKRLVARHRGMPALYVRRDLFREDGTPPVDRAMYPYVKPFDTEGENKTYEREWRVPRDVHFAPDEIAYVIVPRDERAAVAREFPRLATVLDYELLLEAL